MISLDALLLSFALADAPKTSTNTPVPQAQASTVISRPNYLDADKTIKELCKKKSKDSFTDWIVQETAEKHTVTILFGRKVLAYHTEKSYAAIFVIYPGSWKEYKWFMRPNGADRSEISNASEEDADAELQNALSLLYANR